MFRLPHWVLTDKFPSLYDSDSLTVIQQTARVYGAMQQLVDEYNLFVDNVNAEIEKFETGSINEFEEFTVGIRQEFQDFIDVINLKYKNQDNLINGAIDYMKVNLDQSISEMVSEMRQNGTLNGAAMNALNDLQNEINALSSRMSTFTSLEEGSTTGDAELMDARVDFKGNTHDSVGDHIRSVSSELNEKIVQEMNGSYYAEKELLKNTNSLLPRTLKAWAQGATDNTYRNRVYTPEYIDVSGCDRVYVTIKENSPISVYIEAYTGDEENGFFRKVGYGYYYYGYAEPHFNVREFGYTAIRITIKKNDDSDFTPNDVIEMLNYISIEKYYNKTIEPVKMRFLQFNMGKFNYGVSGGLNANVEEKILNYKRFLGKVQADICCFQEYPMDNFSGYIPTIDSAGNYEPDETIFNKLYDHTSVKHFGCVIKDNISYISSVGISIDEADATYRTKGVINVYNINGKTLGVLCGFFNVSAPETSRYSQLNDCFARLADYDYAVICVDSNVLSQEELDNHITTAKANGYEIANGEYWGGFDTIPTSSMFNNIDQIYCKNCKMVNAVCEDVYDELSSDHLPIYADIIFR